jgi:preprotein translocase subunit YajC
MNVFLAQDNTSSEGGGLLFPLLMIVGLFVIFYFLLIRPNRKRRQVVERLQSELAVGDEVMTSSGLYATVAELDDKTVILETSEGVYSRYARGAIMEVVSSSGVPEPEPTAAETADSVIERDSKD